MKMFVPDFTGINVWRINILHNTSLETSVFVRLINDLASKLSKDDCFPDSIKGKFKNFILCIDPLNFIKSLDQKKTGECSHSRIIICTKVCQNRRRWHPEVS